LKLEEVQASTQQTKNCTSWPKSRKRSKSLIETKQKEEIIEQSHPDLSQSNQQKTRLKEDGSV
jgi:hypothetical protein